MRNLQIHAPDLALAFRIAGSKGGWRTWALHAADGVTFSGVAKNRVHVCVCVCVCVCHLLRFISSGIKVNHLIIAVKEERKFLLTVSILGVVWVAFVGFADSSKRDPRHKIPEIANWKL